MALRVKLGLLAIVFVSFFSVAVQAAPVLDGKQVLLIVSEERHDLDGEWLELALRGMRHDLGLSGREIPVVRMGFDDQDANSKHFKRLGVTSQDGPLVCLVQWGQTASEGPADIVDGLVVRGATRDGGLEAPRSVFVAWLERTGRESLISLILPQPEPANPPEPAQVAYDQRRYAEAIELAREVGLHDLEERAKSALRNQALLAASEDRNELALSVYKKLSILYPEDLAFRNKVEDLSITPADYIVGRWKLVSSSGWVEFSAYPDGRLKGRGALHLIPFKAKMEGHWEVTGATERTFQLHWKNGNLHNLKVHENLESMEGRGLKDGEVSAERLGDLTE